MDKAIIPVDDYKFIKKHYGEEFAKLCRSLFPTILETPGLLSKTIFEKISPCSTLAEDLGNPEEREQFQNFILKSAGVKSIEIAPSNGKTPKQLMEEAGYTLFDECKTEEDIQVFKKYYQEGEELCTFRGKRLDTCRVWFAVKKNLDLIKRSDKPQREDEYGTSVISIQFTKGNHPQLSIKNRYNHTVSNPDATYSNNLERIIPGLTKAFSETYGINFEYGDDFQPPDDYILVAGRLYKILTISHSGDYATAEGNFVISMSEAKQYNPQEFLIFENFIIDFKEKTIKNVYLENNDSSFIDSIGKIKKINISYDEKKNKVVTIEPEEGDPIYIVLNKKMQIVKYKNTNIKTIGDDFLYNAEALEYIDIPNVVNIGDNFLKKNKEIKSISFPNVRKIGKGFMYWNRCLNKFEAPNLQFVRQDFLSHNSGLTELYLPSLESCGSNFLFYNENLRILDLPQIKSIGESCFYNNEELEELNAPMLEAIWDNSFSYNTKLKKLNCPKLNQVGYYVFERNENIRDELNNYLI